MRAKSWAVKLGIPLLILFTFFIVPFFSVAAIWVQNVGLLPANAVLFASNSPSTDRFMATALRGFYGSRIGICDGTADQTESQAAINTIVSGEVLFSAGNYDFTGHVSMKSNVSLRLQQGAVLKLHDNTLYNITQWDTPGVHDSYIFGPGGFDQNTANNPGTGDHTIRFAFGAKASATNITRVGVYGVTVWDAGNNIFAAVGARNIMVEDSTFLCSTNGTGSAPIEYIYVTGGIIANNKIIVSSDDFHCKIEIQNSSGITTTGNVIHGSGFLIFSTTNSIVMGNTIIFPSTTYPFVGFEFSQHDGIYSKGNAISGNTIIGAGTTNGTGIAMQLEADGGARCNSIIGNTFRNLKQVIAVRNNVNGDNSFESNICEILGDDPLQFENTENWTIKDNKIRDSASVAVYFIGNCSGGRFEGNDISGSGLLDIKFETGVTGTPVMGRNKFALGFAGLWNKHLATWEPNYVVTSRLLDLSGASTDVIVVSLRTDSVLVRYDIVYTEASSADAGVEIRVGHLDDTDRFDVSTSEASKAVGYTKTFNITDLTTVNSDGVKGISIGTAGGKTGTGEVQIILWIAEISS